MKKYACVTGSSKGIGREFVYALNQLGYSLILVSRNKQDLIDLSQEINDCLIYDYDLSIEDNCLKLYEEIKNLYIEVFINNAGFGYVGEFIDSDLDNELNMINLNIKALHIFTKLMIKHMNKQETGYILNVSSSASFAPAGPYMATYYASKHYVTALTLALQYEINNHIYIGLLAPGPVNTSFNKRANAKGLKGIEASKCVSYAIKKMFKKKKIIIPSITLRIGIMLSRFLPTSLYIKFIAHQQLKKKEYLN